MAKIMVSPGKYVQGKNVLDELGEHIGELGDNILAVCDSFIRKKMSADIEQGLSGKQFSLVEFGGECSHSEIERLQKEARREKSDVIAGFGGGKTLDAVKAAAYYLEIPVVIFPTIAATDAPCSALSVIYTEDGVFEEYLFLSSNPELVIVDTGIIAEAPVEFLVSGMGDALATYFEAEACSGTRKENIAGGTQTSAALSLARLCYQLLLDYGLSAKKAVEVNAVTEAVEKIVEANTLLSGLGFESGGLAAAHSIHNGLTVLEETHDKFHGEKVAFATIVQLILEDRDPAETQEVVTFCKEIGLPTSLDEMGIVDPDEDEIMQVAEASCAEGETIHNMPFEVEPNMLKDAILAADNF